MEYIYIWMNSYILWKGNFLWCNWIYIYIAIDIDRYSRFDSL